MIDIKKAAEQLVPYLRACGSKDEADISMDRGDHYKPTYRTITLFIAPTLPYIDEVLGGEKPTKEQAEEIMRLADPYFSLVLDNDREEFDFLWDAITDAWSEPRGKVIK